MVSLSILLSVSLPSSTFDCDSHMHYFYSYTPSQYFCLLYMMEVCLIVTLPGIPLNFDTPSQSFRVQHSLTVILIVVLADSPFNFDTRAKVKIIARECSSAEPY